MNLNELIAARAQYSDDIDKHLSHVERGGLSTLFPGFGKSHKNIELISNPLIRASFKRVIVVTGAKRNQDEYIRTCKKNKIKFVVLEGKPSYCPERSSWQAYEEKSLFRLGKSEVCEPCQLRKECPYGRKLEEVIGSAEVVITTSAKLQSQPGLLGKLMKAIGTFRPLLLFDEDSYLMSARVSTVYRSSWLKLAEILPDLQESLVGLAKGDLKSRGKLRSLLRSSAYKIEKGWHQSFPEARCPLQDLQDVVEAQASGFWIEGSTLHCIRRPKLHPPYLITAQNASLNILKQNCELDSHPIEFIKPISNDLFEGSRLINLLGSYGTAGNFSGNVTTIVHHLAPFIFSEIHIGRRVLLVCKKSQMKQAKKVVMETGKKLCEDWKVVSTADVDFSTFDFVNSSPDVIPLIHYGFVGVNTFETFENALCLSSYYTNDKNLNAMINQGLRSDETLSAQIYQDESGYRRVRTSQGAELLLPFIQDSFDAQEKNVVLNTIGRVRPWTRSRTVVVQQRNRYDELGVETVFSFSGLRKALKLNNESFSQFRKRVLKKKAIPLLDSGLTQQTVARRLGISRSTLHRCLSECVKTHL